MSKARDSVEDLKTLDANLAAKLPKAGGTMTGDTLHGDNVKAKFGTGNDLEIYHDGSNSYVRDIGTGNLLITTDGGEIRMLTNNVNEFGLRIVQDDYVGLYHNNAAKLHTTSTGIDVTGNVDLPDNGKLLLGAGDDLQIYHDGTNSHIADNGTGNLILNGNEVRILSDDTSEYSGRFITNGAVELYYDSAKKLSTTATGIDVTGTVTADGLGVSGNSSPNVSVTSTGGSVTLWSGADDAAGYVGTQSNHPLVLRTNQTERMRIDTSGRVGIGTSSPTSPLHITGSGHTALTITGGTTSDAQIRFGDSSNTTIGMINYDNAINALKFVVNGSTAAIIDNAGHAIIGGGVTLGNGSTYAAANTLDDYEEGTWTPTGVNYTGSFSSIRATYVKIGKKVFITLFCASSDDNSTTATFTIGGLPFAPDSTGGSYSTFSTMNYNCPNGTAISGAQVVPNNTNLRMLKKTSATSSVWADWQGQDVNAGEINLSFSYSVS